MRINVGTKRTDQRTVPLTSARLPPCRPDRVKRSESIWDCAMSSISSSVPLMLMSFSAR